MTAIKSPELLLPAGSLDKMRAAYDFGADAIYAGQPRYSLRARNNEFKLEQIGIGIAEAHARGKKFFVTSNLLPHNDKVRTYLRDIEPVIAMKPDAVRLFQPPRPQPGHLHQRLSLELRHPRSHRRDRLRRGPARAHGG
jgi:putative protease